MHDWLYLSKICAACLKIVSTFNKIQLTLSTGPIEEKPKGAMRESLAATGLWLPPLLSGRVSFPLQLSNETLLHSAWSPYIVEFLSGENIFLNLLEYWYYLC